MAQSTLLLSDFARTQQYDQYVSRIVSVGISGINGVRIYSADREILSRRSASVRSLFATSIPLSSIPDPASLSLSTLVSATYAVRSMLEHWQFGELALLPASLPFYQQIAHGEADGVYWNEYSKRLAEFAPPHSIARLWSDDTMRLIKRSTWRS